MPATPSRTFLRFALLALAFALSGVFLIFAIRQVDLAAVGAAVRAVAAPLLATALGFFWIEQAFRALRWRRIVAASTPAPLAAVTRALVLGNAINIIAPAKLGELARVHILGRALGVSRALPLGSVALERLIDVAIVCLAALAGAIALTRPGHDGIDTSVALLGLTSVAAGLAGLLIFSRWWAARAPSDESGPIRSYVFARIASFVTGMAALSQRAHILPLMLGTAAVWLANSAALYFLALSLGVTLPVMGLVLLIGLSGLSAALPAGPAGMGVLQVAYVFTFRFCDLPAETGFAAASLVQAVFFGSIVLAAGAVLLFDLARTAAGRGRHERAES